jgi:hypothetical protein
VKFAETNTYPVNDVPKLAALRISERFTTYVEPDATTPAPVKPLPGEPVVVVYDFDVPSFLTNKNVTVPEEGEPPPPATPNGSVVVLATAIPVL